MSELKKLVQAKRILAMILAAAMTVTSLPVTAFAAPVTDDVSAAAEENTDDALAQDGVDDTQDAADVTDVADDADEAPAADEADTTPDADAQGEASLVQELQDAPDVQAEGDPAAPEKIVYSFEDYEYWAEEDRTVTYKKGETPFTWEDDGEPDKDGNPTKVLMVNGDILQKIYLCQGEDAERVETLASSLKEFTYTWQKKGADGNYAAMAAGKGPEDAGEYRLDIELPAKENAYDKAEHSVYFTIKQAVVKVPFQLEEVVPGSKVKDVKAEETVAAATREVKDEYGNKRDEVVAEFTYDTTENTQLSFTLTVKDPLAGTTLGADDVLLKDKDYIVDAAVSFTDKVPKEEQANYVFDELPTQKIKFSELKASKVELALTGEKETARVADDDDDDDNDKTVFKVLPVKNWDGQPAAAPAYTPKVLEPGENEKGETVWTEIQGAAAEEGKWHSAVYESWTENKKNDKGETESRLYCNLTVGGELEAAPSDAGMYVYRVAYKGGDGIHAESYADIVVEIKAVDLTVRPTLTQQFFSHQTAADVLAAVGYEVYDAADARQTLTDRYWGTGYDEVNRTQPYEPVFEVVETKTEKGVATERTLARDDELLYSTTDVTYSYKVRFSGNKAIYSANGSVYNEVDINDPADSTSKNRRVATDADTLNKEGNTAAVTVNNAELVTIDTTDITAGFGERNADFHDAVMTTYNGNPLFAARADYKKAKVTGTDVSGTNPALAYEWYSATYGRGFLDALDEDEKLDGVKPTEWERETFLSPVGAGIYKLRIVYTDATAARYAVPAEVYFVIRKEQVAVSLAETLVQPLEGHRISEFVDEVNKLSTSIQAVNAASAAVVAPESWAEDKDYWDSDPRKWAEDKNYAVKWKVQKEVLDTASKTEGAKKFVDVGSNESFRKPAEAASTDTGAVFSYRLVVGQFVCRDANFTGWKNVITSVELPAEEGKTPEKEKKRTSESLSAPVALTVGDMGDKELVLNTDKQIKKEKEYDGTPIDLSAELAAVCLNDKAAGTKADVPFEPKWYDVTDGNRKEILPEEAVNGGTYEVYVSYRGDATYSQFREEKVAEAKITPKKLTLTPKAPAEAVVAGTEAWELMAVNPDNSVFEGYVENDAAAFGWMLLPVWDDDYGRWSEEVGCLAWYHYDEDGEDADYRGPYLQVCDSKGNVLDGDDILKGEADYKLELGYEGEMAEPFSRNYELTAGEAASFKTVRGNSEVSTKTHGSIKQMDSEDDIDGMSHTVSILDAIEFSSYTNTEDNETVYGNFVAVDIKAPNEYEGSIPRNAALSDIKENGGDIVSRENGHIVAVFDATDHTDKTFKIAWEDGYVETFTLAFSKALLLEDLREAVAPKTIAFNKPNKKMAVGETQNLNVKLSKVLKSDVICLGYESGDSKILSVNEYGKVTALQKGSATITVYPVHLVDGVKTRIDGAKSASVKITVTDIEAPKVSKVTPVDNYATVEYSLVKNGYRREIYVLEGKKTADDFKTEIDKMSNEQWEGIFATAPVFMTRYCTDTDCDVASCEYAHLRKWDPKKGWIPTKTVNYELSGLKRNTEYTVYVRNVSAMRTLSDGSEVALSYAGTVKTFTTTKAQVKNLESALKGDRAQLTSMDWKYSYPEIENNPTVFYEVPLQDGSVELDVTGWFEALVKDPSADTVVTEDGLAYDALGYPLPFADKSLKNDYVEPKLAYYFVVDAREVGNGYDAVTGSLSDMDEAPWYRVTASEYAVINKKGKITLKQPGPVYVQAVDTATRVGSNIVAIDITSKADSMKGKNVTLQVGQSIRLENLVTYKAGKNVLDSESRYFDHGIVADAAFKNAVEATGCLRLVQWDGYNYIEAIAPAKSAVTVSLQDAYVEGASTAAKIKVKPLQPVKGLKFVDVIDKQFTVQFDEHLYADAFRIEVKNARGTIIRSAYVEAGHPGRYDDEWASLDEYDAKRICGYREINGKWYFAYIVKGLTQQSKYTVSVTALYEDQVSKTVKKVATTTKLPATDNLYDFKDSKGGISITVSHNVNDVAIDEYSFVTGNDYTLRAWPDNTAAREAATDTLSWNSTNKKVATIKANAGSYSATLKAVGEGSTFIEVKSKITKKVIARYPIFVKTVGDAYSAGSRYYSDNEDLRDEEGENYVYTEITLGNPVAVNLSNGLTKYFTFKAPEAGRYNFYRVENGKTYSINSNVSLAKNQKRTFSTNKQGSYTVVVERADASVRTPLFLNTPVTVNAPQGFVFTAPKEAWYNFGGLYVYEDNKYTQLLSNAAFCKLNAGQTVYLRVTDSVSRRVEVKELVLHDIAADSAAVSITKTDYQNSSYYKFTAPADGEYRFTVDGGGKNTYYKEVELLSESDFSGLNKFNSGYNSCSVTHILGKGDTVLVRVYGYVSENSPVTLKVETTEKKITVNEVKTGENPAALAASTDNYLAFTAAEEGLYQFKFTDVNGSYTVQFRKNLVDSDGSNFHSSNAGYYKLAKDEKVYLHAKPSVASENAKLTVAKMTVMPMDGAEVEIPAGEERWFALTSVKDKKYDFTLTSDVMLGYVYLYTAGNLNNNNIGHVNISGGNIAATSQYTFTADGTVYWKLTNSTSGSAKVKVKAEEMVVTPLGKDGEAFDLASGGKKWMSFKASESAYYDFTAEAEAGSGELTFYRDLGNDSASSVPVTTDNKGLIPSMWIGSGRTVYLEIAASSDEFKGTVKAAKTEVIRLEEGDNTVDLSRSTIAQFSVPEKGSYRFTIDSTERSGSLSLSDHNNVYYSAIYINGLSWICQLPEGLVYLNINNDSENSNLKINLEKVDPVVPVNEGKTCVSVEYDDFQWLAFTALAEGEYEFAVNSGYGKIWLFADDVSLPEDRSQLDGAAEDFTNGDRLSLSKAMSAGETVYLAVSNSDGYGITNHTVNINNVNIEEAE